MIKYVELTAPEASAYRQAKILSIECAEGDVVREGDTLFRVQSGSHELNLPSTLAGRVVEVIATVQENITFSTPLVLLETEVADDPSRSTKPPSRDQASTAQKPNDTAKKDKTKPAKKHQQQSLNLAGDAVEEVVLDQVVEPGHPIHRDSPSGLSATPKDTNPVSQTMSKKPIINITVPDIGTDSAKVIDILVKVGDTVAAEDPLITLESDKASMDVPSTHDGVVSSISVLLDQDVSEGTIILELETSEGTKIKPKEPEQNTKTEDKQTVNASTKNSASSTSTVEVKIPDIGGDSAKVIDILVEVGQQVANEDPLVTLESDKASMDVPSSASGTIASIEVSLDQDVQQGTVVVTLTDVSDSTEAADTTTHANTDSQPSAKEQASKPEAASTTRTESPPQAESTPAPTPAAGKSHASPSVRRLARELGVDLSQINGSGRKGRISKDDVKHFVKGVITTGASTANTSGSGIPPIPAQDFSKFGDVELQPLNKIKRLTATNLHRSWVNVPHVTHNDETNISDLEAFRKQLNAEYAKQKKEIKLSPLAFIVKAVVNALQTFPQFNSSLEPGGENLILKKYFHIGIAVDTPNGLVVPVIRDADVKSVAEIAVEMGELAQKARDKKLTMNDMSGACFTISSLGGIGGTGFTPIVNAPEVAILGVSRTKVEPVWNGSEFVPGKMLPLSLSYDHRVIDGAEAARFTRHIASLLEDLRRLTV